MPWHDIAVRVKGSAVKDLTRHFIQYWNFVRTTSLLPKNKNTEMTTPTQKKQNWFMRNNKKTIGLDTQKIMTDHSQGIISPLEEKKYECIVKDIGQSTMRMKLEDSDEPRISNFDRYTWSNKDKLKLDEGNKIVEGCLFVLLLKIYIFIAYLFLNIMVFFAYIFYFVVSKIRNCGKNKGKSYKSIT